MRVSLFALLGMLYSCTSSPAYTTTDANLSPFKIEIERTPNGLSASCTEGCNWKNLSSSSETTLHLNRRGISTDLPTVQAPLGTFSFTVTEDGDQLQFISYGGTAWTKLHFTLREGQRQGMDEMGMAE